MFPFRSEKCFAASECGEDLLTNSAQRQQPGEAGSLRLWTIYVKNESRSIALARGGSISLDQFKIILGLELLSSEDLADVRHTSLEMQRFGDIPGHYPDSVLVPLASGLYIGPPNVIPNLIGLRHSAFSVA
jgi:hypothetical protein